MTEGTESQRKTQFAGFWRRLSAFVLDYLIVSTFVFAIFVLWYQFVNKQAIPRPPIYMSETVTKSYKTDEKGRDGKKFDHIEFIHVRYFDTWDAYSIKKVPVPSETTKYVVGLVIKIGNSPEVNQLVPNDETKKLEPGFVIFSDQLSYLLLFLYSAIMEASKFKGTIGKRLLRMVVTDYEGNALTLGRSLARSLLKIPSLLILGIGFLFVAFTKKKQGAHDLIAKTYVLKRVS